MPDVVIIADDGSEHVFPSGFDPKKAASIVRGAPMRAAASPKPFRRQADEAVSTFASKMNPLPLAQFINRAVVPEFVGDALGMNDPRYLEATGQAPTGPVNAVNAVVSGILGPVAENAAGAVQAAREGDWRTASTRAMTAVPLVGPVSAEMRQQLERGDVGQAVGTIGALATQAAIPSMLSRARSVSARSPFQNRNQAEVQAVEFGQREGVPIDAATATGNRFVSGVQRGIVDQSMAGSVVAERAKAAEAEALSQLGNRLARRASASATTPEQAGQAVRGAITNQVTAAHRAANTAYARLSRLERLPKHQRSVQVGTRPGAPAPPILGPDGQQINVPPQNVPVMERMPLPVDLEPAKQALAPIHARLMREAEITPLMGGKARAATALDRLMNGPRYQPLSAVDDALGDLKAMARGADIPELRTQGQGLAAEAVQNLERTVRATAQQAGPDVYEALMAGRLATRAKYGAADVLGDIADEPVSVFRAATAGKDAGIERLKSYARLAPREVREVGRAYLEDLLTKATAQGSFDQARGLWAEWQRMGPETKRVLFRDKGLVSDLDNFFLLSKKLAENPNPSGTALTVMKGAEMSAWAWNAPGGVAYSIGAAGMSKLLRNPRAVKLLSRGLTMKVGGPSQAAATATAELANIARAEGVALVPLRAEQSPTTTAERSR